MTSKDFCSLFSSLNNAVDIMNANRTPDPEFVAAFDTLKQARAMVARVMSQNARIAAEADSELVAA